MEFRYILEFVNLIDVGSFSESAEEQFISQSSLSKHMKTLETDLGAPLFERASKRKVALTEFGQLFYPYARQLSETWQEFCVSQQQYQQARQEKLSIGSIPMLTYYHISDVLDQFQTEYPDIQLNLQEAESGEAQELLRQQVLDFAFVREYPNSKPDGFIRIPYTSDHLAAVLPASHPLAGQKTLRLFQLAQEPFLLLQNNTFMYTLCISECRKAGFEPNVVFQGAMAANIVNLVRRGHGISLLTRQPIEPLLTPDVVLVDIEPIITTDIDLIYLDGRHLPGAANTFLNFCRKRFQEPMPQA